MSTPERVLITGANKGIGRAMVKAVLEARSDARVFLGSRDRGRGEAAREELSAGGGGWGDRIEVVELDVSKDASVKAAAEVVADACGGAPLYGIVNNAGIGLGSKSMERVLNVNVRGPRRVCEAFLPLLRPEGGRIVNISSASGPMFVSGCSPERQRAFTDSEVTWSDVEGLMQECVALAEASGAFRAAGFGDGAAYGLSKACLNAYTIALARSRPGLVVNACTPGFIETDLTRPYAESRGVTPEQAGMKPPEAGTRAAMKLLFGEPGGSGWYFGSDGVRSPLDEYRSPGDPPHVPGD